MSELLPTGALAKCQGWGAAFLALAVLTMVTAGAALLFYYTQVRQPRHKLAVA
jgi:hypothetical protein